MAYRRCPSCGQGYNGKRCRNCLYEPFGEVTTSFELHREEVELLPVRRPAAPARREYPTRSRKKNGPVKNIFKAIGIAWAVMLVLTGLLPMLFAAFEDVGSSFVTATPEPMPLPASGVVLYEDADILVLADWDGTPIDSDLSIFVQNFTGEDLTVCTDGVAINGCMVEDVFFYCDAYRDSVSMATLWVDMETLGQLGLKEGQYIQMAIDVMDEDYNTVVNDAMAELGDASRTQELSASGTIFYDQDGFQLICKGIDPDPYGEPRLVFYAENRTDSFLELSSEELLINGEETGCYLWQKLFPGTRSIFYGYLYDFDLPQDNALAELELFLTPDGDWSREICTGPLNFPLD